MLLTDGQACSGVVEDALKLTRTRNVPIFVVGVGSLQGGVIPDPKRAANPDEPIIRSALDRRSLTTIATTSGGRYLELDRESDVAIANQVIDAARRAFDRLAAGAGHAADLLAVPVRRRLLPPSPASSSCATARSCGSRHSAQASFWPR